MLRQERHVRRSGWAFMTVILAFALAGYACASKEEKAAKHFQKAKEYMGKNELKKAVIELKNVVQLDPQNDAAYVELGESHLKLRETREAFQAFSMAVRVNPGNLKAQLKLGQMLLLGKQTEEARKKAELILQKSPDHIEGLTLLSGVQLQEKDLDGAIKTLEKAASADPKHFNTHLSLGRLYLMKGLSEKAEQEYLKAISLDPTSSIPYIEVSRIYANRGAWEEAEEELKKMLEASGAGHQNLNILAMFYESAGKNDMAEKTYLSAVEASPKEDVSALLNLGAYYARQKSYDKALKAMQQAAELKKDDLNIQVAIAQLQLDFARVKEAELTVDKVLEKDKGNSGANFLKGRLFLNRKEYGNALERFDIMVRDNPRNAGAYYFRALSHLGKGDGPLGRQDLIKALEINPGLLDARVILAEVHLRERNQDLAGQQIDAALKLAPRDVRALMMQGALKLLQNDAQGAENTYRKILEINPQYAPAHAQMGSVFAATGRPQDAVQSYKKALDLDPRQMDALVNVVIFLLNDKKNEEAYGLLKDHKKKLADSPSDLAMAEYLEGNVFLAKNDLKSAEKRFRQAIETDPNVLPSYSALARIYIQEKRFDEAIAQYQEILTRNPNNLAAYMAIATMHDAAGSPDKAEAYYRKALEINKDFGPAANNLAWSLAQRGGNIDEALNYAQIAKRQMPNSAAVMDTLGWVYYLKGSYLSAIAEFQDSLAREPNNALINYHMGMAQFKNNDPGKARFFLEKALELNPGFKGAEEARKVLKEIKGS